LRPAVRLILVAAALSLVVAACGSSSEGGSTRESGSQLDLSAVSGPAPAAGTCLAGDPACEDFDDTTGAEPPPELLTPQPFDEAGPLLLTFGGYFVSDGTRSQLCASLAESFPPQCGETIIEIEGDYDLLLESVRESFGNPDDASLFNEGDIWWTDEFINLRGELIAGRLIIE